MEHSLIWNLTLGPIVAIYKIIFEFCYFITHNYGVSLLLLSVATSVLMLPLWKWASKIVLKQKKIESILTPQLLRIKENFRGSERHEAIGRLYKRYRYNPLRAALGATGVLIQLPFLIGAFYMLSEFPAIQGISFGPIKNLAEPDRLIGNYINLLPVLMTVVNMLSAYLNPVFNRQERRQAYAIAFLFCILLYKAPSALLVYWTGNNLISLGKVVTIRLLYFKEMSIQRNILRHNPDIATVLGLTIAAILFFLLARSKSELFHIYSVYFKFISDASFIIAICFCLLTYIFNKENWQKNYELVLLVGIFLLTGFSLVRFLSIYGFHGSGYKFSTQLCVNLACVLLFGFKNQVRDVLAWFRGKEFSNFFLPLGVLAASLICLYFPAVLYNSDPSAFIQNKDSILAGQFLYFEIAVAMLLFANLFFFKGLKGLLAILIFSGIIAAFIWNFWNDPKLGALSNYVFQNPKVLEAKNLKNFYLVAYLIGLLLSIFLMITVKTNWLKTTLWLITACFVIYPFLPYAHQTQDKSLNTYRSAIFSKELNEFLTFSKNGKNIIVIMLDMFSPSDMEVLLKVDPELKNTFSSFTFYPDTLSSGISTIFGKAPLLGGEDATPWKLNEDKALSLEEKVNKSWSIFFQKLALHDYQIELNDNKWYSWFDPRYYSSEILTKIVVSKDEHPLVSSWDIKNNYKNDISGDPSNFLTLFGLFKISPYSLKSYIYDRGNWLKRIDRSDEIEWSHRELPLLDALSTQVKFTDSSKNKFKFLSTLLTHVPWTLNQYCKPSSKPVRTDLYSSLGIKWDQRLQSELCSLNLIGNFLGVLKENDVFSNTMVLIVSDHGTQGAHTPKQANGLSQDQLRDGSLLLVKEFGEEKGELRISDYLTTNYDVPNLILNALDNNQDFPWMNKNRKRKTVHGDWQRHLHPKNNYKLKESYVVKGSMFQNSHWVKEF